MDADVDADEEDAVEEEDSVVELLLVPVEDDAVVDDEPWDIALLRMLRMSDADDVDAVAEVAEELAPELVMEPEVVELVLALVLASLVEPAGAASAPEIQARAMKAGVMVFMLMHE